MMSEASRLEEGSELRLDFQKRGGLIPVVVQEAASGQILMVAYASPEAFEKTLRTGKATFFSTSRNQLWTKGETSGDWLEVVEILTDCDQDALVYRVKLLGDGVCHTYQSEGVHRRSCFYRKIRMDAGNTLEKL